jgi:hypothetical protein
MKPKKAAAGQRAEILWPAVILHIQKDDSIMKKFFSALLCLIASLLAAAAGAATWTVTGPTFVLDANGTIHATQALCQAAAEKLAAGTYHCTDSRITTIVGSAAPPPPPPPPPSGAQWGYNAGQWSWAGDYSANAVPNYHDTQGASLSGSNDIAVQIVGAWGLWQPYMCQDAHVPMPQCTGLWSYSTADMTKLTFSLKPTVANQQWSVYFMGVGDQNLNCFKDVLKYGLAPVVGKWATYTIPLSDLCVGGGIDVYKFAIQDQTGLGRNTWYVDNVGFIP